MTLTLAGVVDQVLVALNARAVEDDVLALLSIAQPSVKVTLEGFVGDKHAGITARSSSRTPHFPLNTLIRNCRQVSIISLDELALIADHLGVARILLEWLGANLSLDYVPDLTRLPPTTRLFFPHDAVLVVEGENLPCVFPGKVLQQWYPGTHGLAGRFPKAALHHRGVVAWVERAGTIRQADEVTVRMPSQVIYSLPTEYVGPVSAGEPRSEVPSA